ncbi:MAG: FtsQ-type POTRA domain-containing protein [Patescibacteria group bacterium]|nr:FtsQ-type POTRA domain-containing protein [Patescibacteria group bacterium]MDE1988406.1 FtsQ-type POTRA domain-containing protein [Patescibacteria group bacterium]MDE2217858.1 FtsQ-type POTRA domain-containing protein [Patescibacteria group bacterium]
MARRNPNLKSSLARKRRRKIFAIKAVLVFLLSIGFVFLLSWFSRISPIQIAEIEVSGNSSVSGDEIMSLVKKETSGNYFMLFSKNSVFLYPKKSIETKLADNFKKIEKAEIKFEGFKKIIVKINERKAESLWCSGGKDAENDRNENLRNCYFMDKEGVIFSAAPKFSGNVFMRYYGLLDDVDPIGKGYMSAEKFKGIIGFVSSLKNFGLAPVVFMAKTGSDYEISLEDGGRIIFDDRQSFDKTSDNLESVLGEIGLVKNRGAISGIKLDYVDLRFGNKVFYKTK